VLNYVQYSVGM